jgi:serine O-acetyltransferase
VDRKVQVRGMTLKLKSLIHIVFFKRSSSKEEISADVKRWIQILRPDMLENPLLENLVWLLEMYPEFRNVFYFRLGRYEGNLSELTLKLAKFLYKPVESFFFLDYVTLGPGFFVEHGLVTLIGAHIIGKNCWINSGVTIGYKTGLEKSLAIIGDNVYIGAGAKILGPVTIGDNVLIGANAVITRNVPSNCTVVGVPARIVKREGQRVDEPLPRLTAASM